MNEKGYIYLEALIVIAIIGAVFSTSAIIGRNILADTLAEYEATKLISSIRYVRELNRNSYVVREGEFKEIEPVKSTLFRITISDHYYEIKSTSNKFPTQRYRAIKNVELWKTESLYDGIRFNTDGMPKTFGRVKVQAKFGNKTAFRYVIIDRGGRIRMDRISE